MSEDLRSWVHQEVGRVRSEVREGLQSQRAEVQRVREEVHGVREEMRRALSSLKGKR